MTGDRHSPSTPGCSFLNRRSTFGAKLKMRCKLGAVMAEEDNEPTGSDLNKGIALASLLENGMLIGYADEDEVLLVRRGDEVFAVSPHCTHYHGPLAEGLVVGTALRRPRHHACFDLRSGEALRAPAFDPLERFRVELRDGLVFVREKMPAAKSQPRKPKTAGRIVVASGGAAGSAAAEMRSQYSPSEP